MKIKMKTIEKEKLFRVDQIRFLKIMEMVYFAIIGLILVLPFAWFINNYLLINYEEKNYVNYVNKNPTIKPIIFLHIIWDIIIIIVCSYYLKKIALTIPFIFSFVNQDYKSGLHGENMVGFMVGFASVYWRQVKNFTQKLDFLTKPIEVNKRDNPVMKTSGLPYL